jgi:hypothetical protein
MSLFSRKTAPGPANPSPGPARTIRLTKDSTGSSAINLSKVRDAGHIDLAKRADKAGIALSKRGLAGIRAQAVLVLDHSGSMHDDYANGKVQTMVERVLGFALQIDVDGTVPVIPFDSRVHPAVEVTVDNYSGVVDQRIWHPRQMGTTDLAAALVAVRELAKTTDEPIFCVVVTDGNPDSQAASTKTVCELAGYPVFLKFLAIRDVPYLNLLNNMGADQRLLDNVNTKAFNDPASVSDMEFADAMADEWDSWVAAATKAGVLT